MTMGFDLMYDVNKLKGNPDIALYTKIPENETYDLAIQALPTEVMEDIIIPVGLDCWLGGEYEFEADIEGLPSHIDVIFEDKKENAITVLSEVKNRYYTTIEEGEFGTGRFYLVLKNTTTTGLAKTGLNQFNVFTRNKTIFIDGPANDKTWFTLHSIDGKQWTAKTAESMNRNKIDGSAFPPGVYVLRINHNKTKQTKKLVLMH
jgi:hypothetical protein